MAGVLRNVCIDVDGHESIIDLIVIDHKDHDVLLGMDWFRSTRAGIFPASNELVFPEMEQPLTKGKEDAYRKNYICVDVLLTECDNATERQEEEGEFGQDEVDWNFRETKAITFAPQAMLTTAEKHKFTMFIRNNLSAFASDLSTLSECNVIEHEIVLEDKTPIYLRPYRKSEHERHEIRKQIAEMLGNGIIRKSRSAYSSPLILVPKPNGTKRICIDCRKLNKVTVRQNWPLPLIQDVLDRLSGSIFFSTLDLKSGYWQVAMHKDSIALTAFSTPDGHFEFVRLPFGLRNAPADFSRLMHRVLGDLDFVEIYLDDLTVHSKTFEEHLQHLETVFGRLREANLKLNPEKCVFVAHQVRILGFIVSRNQVRVDPEKVEAVKDRKPPRNVKEVQQFLGMAGYYRRFIRSFASIAHPLFHLLGKSTRFQWTNECQTAFDTLKQELTKKPVLCQPDLNKPFILFTDASGYAIGAILSQKDDDGREHVVAYASRILKGAEVHYTITEKECLAVVFGIKKFRVYLHGTHFVVVTDHHALNWLINIHDPNGRLARWSIYLQMYEFTVVHRKGRIHSNVDGLSRPVLDVHESLHLTLAREAVQVEGDIFRDEALLKFVMTGLHAKGLGIKQVRRIEKAAPSYCMQDQKILYRKADDSDIWLVVPPPSERKQLIEKEHLLGHFRTHTTYSRLRERYYWFKMIEDVEKFVANCGECRRNHVAPTVHHSAKAIPVHRIFDQIGIDLVLGLPETADGNIGIVVITEYLTKFPFVRPIKSKSALEIAKHLWDYISLFGPPKSILSDQGTEFNNAVVDKLLKLSGIEHKVTSAYNPRTNGLTERFNQTFVMALRKHSENNHLQWDLWIPFVLFAYRGRVHDSTKHSPFFLMFGREMNHFSFDASDVDLHDQCARSNELKELAQLIHPAALENIKLAQERQMKAQNNRDRIDDSVIAVGTSVDLVNDGIIGKLESRYHGPFIVRRVTTRGNYELSDSDGQAW